MTLENMVLDNINIDHSDRVKNHKMLDSKSKKTLEPVNKTARTKFELQQKPKEFEIKYDMVRKKTDIKLKSSRSKPEGHKNKNHQTPRRFKVRRKRPRKENDSLGK